MQELKIQFKKAKDQKQHSIRLERPDGTSEWSYIKSLVHHDLAHFVIETHFGICRGFYGEVLSGTSMEMLSAAGVIKAYEWSADIFLAETLVNAFQQIVLMGEDFNAFSQHLIQIADKNALIPNISCNEFDEIRAKLLSLWKKWDALQPGESLSLSFISNEL